MKIFLALIIASLSSNLMADTYLECHERAGKNGVKEEIVMNIVMKKSEVTVYLHRFEPRTVSFDTKRVLENSTRTGAWLTYDNDLSTLQIEASGRTRRAYFERALKCFEIE